MCGSYAATAIGQRANAKRKTWRFARISLLSRILSCAIRSENLCVAQTLTRTEDTVSSKLDRASFASSHNRVEQSFHRRVATHDNSLACKINVHRLNTYTAHAQLHRAQHAKMACEFFGTSGFGENGVHGLDAAATGHLNGEFVLFGNMSKREHAKRAKPPFGLVWQKLCGSLYARVSLSKRF